MDISSHIESIVSDLESIAERLNDLSMSILSTAIEQGATARPRDEKMVSQARRAVEKALHVLRTG